jgi:hypothetical protein
VAIWHQSPSRHKLIFLARAFCLETAWLFLLALDMSLDTSSGSFNFFKQRLFSDIHTASIWLPWWFYSVRKQKDTVWVKEWDVRPCKPHWRPFCCCHACPRYIKAAEIAPWIHHSPVMPASPEWESVPDPASPCKIALQNACALPHRTLLPWGQ